MMPGRISRCGLASFVLHHKMKTLRLPALVMASLTAFAVSSVTANDRPVVPLWPTGAPGSEERREEPEKTDEKTGYVSNIHQPTLTVYLPAKERSTGAAVIVAPGGGHRFHAIQHEGYNVGQWLADHGVAAFVLKYRLARDQSNPQGDPQPYTIDRDAVADAQRAVRLVRSRAADWNVNPAAVGIMGFSAGGEVAALTAMHGGPGDANAADPIDRLNARPDFQALIYPGQSQRIAPNKESPPAFLAAGFGDRPDISEGLAKVYLLFKQAGVPTELHIYAGAGHGFGLRDTNKSAAGAWIVRFHEWLADRKFLRSI